MRAFLITLLCIPLLALAAEDKHKAEDIKKDVERHRAMATAHEQAAKCLASGEDPQQCQRKLQGACKGLAIGKYCGMKHEH
jgi:hypothetical protein